MRTHRTTWVEAQTLARSAREFKMTSSFVRWRQISSNHHPKGSFYLACSFLSQTNIMRTVFALLLLLATSAFAFVPQTAPKAFVSSSRTATTKLEAAPTMVVY